MRTIMMLLLGLLAVACNKGADGDKKIDVPAWVNKHGPALEAFRVKLDAAMALVKDRPPKTERLADPPTKIVSYASTYIENPNMILVNGDMVRSLPEHGENEGKSLEKGEWSISIAYTGYLDLTSLFTMADKGEPLHVETVGHGDGLMTQLAKVRYVVVGRQVSFRPGAVDVASKTFTPGTFEGVAYLLDLEGPKHLGTVTFAAANTGSFESYSGSEQYMLRSNLQRAAMSAFHTEFRRLFPEIEIEDPPK